jgi:hypothetical protein
MRTSLILVGFGSVVLAATASADLQIEPLPANAPAGFSQFFTKYVDVLGVSVYATQDTQDVKVLRVANVIAQYLDNDEDGVADNPAVLQYMVDHNAAMIMWPTFQEFENSDFFDSIPESSLEFLQDCMGEETNPDWEQTHNFDAALEECLHLVTFAGYSRVYPSVFGESAGSQISNAMDQNIANGYYHYDDPTCDYECLATEYIYWALTSILGAQEAPWRAAEIDDEWELPSRTLMEANDPMAYSILTDFQWGLATVLPDGAYDGEPGDGGGEDTCLGDINGDGLVNAADLGLMLADWDTTAPVADLDGNGTVNGGDLGLLLLSWGPCPGDPCDGVSCNDGDPCTIDACDPETGECVYTPIPGCGDGGGSGECGDPENGLCTEVHATPACSNGECCGVVCAEDPFCCEEEWDIWCVVGAYELCGKGEEPNLDCCEPHDFPGCINDQCEDIVCDIDESCCEVEWDANCASLASEHCGSCS